DHMQHFTLAAQLVEYLGQRQVIVVQHHIQLIENDQTEGFVAEKSDGLLPRLAGAGNVLLAVLGVPGEAVAHRVDFDGEIEPANKVRLAGGNGTLDELDNADFETLT